MKRRIKSEHTLFAHTGFPATAFPECRGSHVFPAAPRRSDQPFSPGRPIQLGKAFKRIFGNTGRCDPGVAAGSAPCAGNSVQRNCASSHPISGTSASNTLGAPGSRCTSGEPSSHTRRIRCTTSGRRTTVFTSIEDRRRSAGYVELAYWLYRPGLGWERQIRRATSVDVAAASDTRVLLKDDPNLVPLETIPGRDQYSFRSGERPPWQWQLQSIYPG